MKIENWSASDHMASLTTIAITSRKIVRYSIYAVIIILTARFVFNIGTSAYKYLFPPKVDPPTRAFGKLPKIPFPERSFPSGLTFILETPDGRLPEFPDRTEVYSMPPVTQNIQALEAAKNEASRMGFDPNGKLVVENVPNVYLFSKSKVPSTLTMNIIARIFSISYDLNSNPSILNFAPSTPDTATAYAQSYLSRAGFLTDDLKNGAATHEFLRIENGKFVPAISLSEANLIKINLFRKNLGENFDIPSVTPDMPESNVWFLLSGKGGREVIAAEYHYFPLDEKKSGTYDIKTSDKTWGELNAGRAFLANLGDNENKQITIRKVYLAYYDAGLYTKYYQPVVVFEGDSNFFAYVPAVIDEHYEE
ncbi:hypothetical protein KKB40_04150 [Patescibacteria group bacterium]|nr:hypothetical protein [Patescibacteria group bacterium]